MKRCSPNQEKRASTGSTMRGAWAPRASDDVEPRWETGEWPLADNRLRAVAGDSPLGLRLPLGSLPRGLPVRTALAAQARDGHVAIFVPPLDALDDYLALIDALET